MIKLEEKLEEKVRAIPAAPLLPPKKPVEVTGTLRLLPPEEEKMESIAIPTFTSRKITRIGLEEEREMTGFKAAYPLIPIQMNRTGIRLFVIPEKAHK